jgi:hypothetical protein
MKRQWRHNMIVRASATSLLAVAVFACAPTHAQVTLFSDDFDAGTSAANWSLYSHAGDYTADFAYDYSTRGIPPAPNSSGGTTVGLHFTVNNNDATPAADAVSAFPIGVTLTGNRTLKCDMWLNYNGGPGGGTGSTEFATFGIHHAGGQVNWANNPSSDGLWFAVAGEGGAADDYRAYDAATLLAATTGGFAAASLNHTAAFYQTLFPSPTYETPGAPGKHWVEVEISQRDGVVEWRLNGMLIAIRLETTVAPGNLMLGAMDTFSSIASPAVDNFVVFDNIRLEGPDCNTNGVPDDVDLSSASSQDCNANGLADECETLAEADFDADGDVDSTDSENLLAGLDGPGVAPQSIDPLCVPAWLDAFDDGGDGSIDVGDYGKLQTRATRGPIPPRASGAPSGSQFMAEVASLTRTDREVRALAEVIGGNVPGFLRNFIAVDVSRQVGGLPVSATIFVMPDYLCIGRDGDFARIPLTPLAAQPIADAFECLLPTRRMVDAIYAAAAVKLAPAPISPATVDIMLATTFYRHHQIVEGQRAGQPLGTLIGGIKKDVVITPLLASNPGKVAIYGWHQLNGSPIQPLYLGHVDWYADYSHGIRLVSRRMIVDGAEVAVADVLADPALHVLLSDEGVVPDPSY